MQSRFESEMISLNIYFHFVENKNDTRMTVSLHTSKKGKSRELSRQVSDDRVCVQHTLRHDHNQIRYVSVAQTAMDIEATAAYHTSMTR